MAKTVPLETAPETGFPGAADLTAHEIDKAARAAARQNNWETLSDCLDPKLAAGYEIQKPRYQFNVRARWKAPGQNGQLVDLAHEAAVVAQNENDAWARFCDAIGHYPGRRACRELEIIQGEQLTVEQFAVDQLNESQTRPYRESHRN